MEEYPRNLTEFEAQFATEEACRAYLERLRWPDGFRCPRCGGAKSWPVRIVLLQCGGCGHQTSVTAGTIFQDTRTPLRLWFQAMWWVTTQKNGASALGLQRVLGLKSYEMAWTWLHPRMPMNHMRAANSSVQLIAAERQFATRFPATGFICDLRQLGQAGLVDTVLASGDKAGYHYELHGCNTTGTASVFSFTGVPKAQDRTGKFAFCANQEGVLWYASGGSTD